jgi:hypothetical protein
MKRIFTLAISLLLCVTGGVHAQGYCFDREGQKLEYVRKYAADGKFCWRHILTVTEVANEGPIRRINTSSGFYKVNGKLYYKDYVLEEMQLDKDDNVQCDMADMVRSYLKARLGFNAVCTGGYSNIPSSVKPGDTLQSVNVIAKLGPLTYTVRIWDRKVVREETLSVPGGTFRCIVLEEKRAETGPGHNRTIFNRTWYAKGIGYVRHDTYIKDVLDTSEILYSISEL